MLAIGFRNLLSFAFYNKNYHLIISILCKK